MHTINSASLPEESGQTAGWLINFSYVWARKYLQKLAEQDDITEALSRSDEQQKLPKP
jgi:hypothetical protein